MTTLQRESGGENPDRSVRIIGKTGKKKTATKSAKKLTQETQKMYSHGKADDSALRRVEFVHFNVRSD